MKNNRFPLPVVAERETALSTVCLYHDRTKHSTDRYAPSLGYMDWANQPNPFRRFGSAPLTHLPLPEIEALPTYDAVLAAAVSPAQVDLEAISRLFFFSLALSAWKQVKRPNGEIAAEWSLRVNPSSGNLHPTEGYLTCGPSRGLASFPGIYHYAPFEHALEMRRRLTDDEWRMLSPYLSDGACLVRKIR